MLPDTPARFLISYSLPPSIHNQLSTLHMMAPKSSRSSPLHLHRSVGPTRLSPHWFFPDGDLLLRCNSTLYLVHSTVLSSASGVFRDALRRPAPTPNMPSMGAPIMGAEKCRTHSKSSVKVVLNQQPGLSLSAQLWLRQNQRRQAMGKPVDRWGSGKAARAPKVLVIEDREINVDYLLYFLYSRPYVLWLSHIERDLTEGRQNRETPITKELLPHILSLGIRYQISAFTSASLSLLKTNATIHPFFVIKTLHPFIPPPGSNFTSPTNIAHATTVIASIYNMAITALLDDFPRCHGPDSRVREEYKASVPLVVQQKCIERWNRYVWDMSFLNLGEMFSPYGSLGMKFEYEHDESCAPSSHTQCLESTRRLLLTQWLVWWQRETIQKGRLVPKPSQLRVFLETIEATLEDLGAEGEGRCGDGVMKGVMKMFERVVGPGIWEDGEEGFQGLRIDEDAVDA